MNFLSNIDVPFGVIFIFPLLWVVGVGVLIIRKNKLSTNVARSQSAKNSLELRNGFSPAGPPENPFDSRLDRQLDLDPRYENEYLEKSHNDDYLQQISNLHRNGR